VRLSRDTEQPNQYLFQCTDGWLRWHVHDADRVELGLGDVEAGFRARLHRVARDGAHPRLGAPRGGFEESFVAQIRNVVDAVRGRAALVVSAADGLASLRTLDACRCSRALIGMPWLGDAELDARPPAEWRPMMRVAVVGANGFHWQPRRGAAPSRGARRRAARRPQPLAPRARGTLRPRLARRGRARTARR